MFISDASRRFALDQAAANPLKGEIQDFSLTYVRSLDDGRVRLASDARQKSLVQAYDDYTDDIFRQTGERLSNPYRVSTDSAAFADSIARDPDAMAKWEADRWAKFDGKVSDLAAKFPGLTVKTRDDIHTDIAERVRGVKDLADRPGLNVGWAGLGRFIGYGQAAMEDPTNAGALLFGGFGGGEAMATAAARATLASRLAPIGGTMLREGVTNAVTEAATQPQVKGFNNELGIDYGWDEVAANVAMAGAGGAVLGGGLHASGLGLKSLLGKWDAAAKAGHVTEDAETRAAAMVLGDVETMRRANPYPPGVEGDAAFAEGMTRAAEAVRAGRPVDVNPVLRQIDDLAERGFLADAAAARQEVRQMAAAMEKTVAHPTAGMDAIVVPMRDADMRTVLMRQGPAIERADGSLWVQDTKHEDLLDRAFGTTGRGLVKILWKHVFPAPRPGAPLRVHVDDVLRMPLVLRRYIPDGMGRGAKEKLEWVIERSDGQRVVYAARRFDPQTQGTFDTMTIMVLPREMWDRKPLSAERLPSSGPGSGGGGKSGAVGSYATSNEALGTAKAPVSGHTPAPSGIMRAPLVERKTLPPELKPPAGKPPETLVGFLKRMGGVKDTDGWLAHMGVDNTVRPGLIAGKGMDLDAAALRAWEDDFFPEFHDRPTPDQLRLQIAGDLGPEGLDRVRGADVGTRLEWDAYTGMMADLDRMGVDPWGKSWEDVQAAVRAAQAAERDEDALWRAALDFINPDAAKALDDETAFIARTHGELLAEDVDIPTNQFDADGKPALQSARDTMDSWDDEAMSWDAATTCFKKAG